MKECVSIFGQIVVRVPLPPIPIRLREIRMYGGVFEGDITDEIGAKLIEPFSFLLK